MNNFYFKNKNNPKKVCYEVVGLDAFSNIRYSVALAGTIKAAQRAMESYVSWKMPPYMFFQDRLPQYSHLFHIEKTTIGDYHKHRQTEMQLRRKRHWAYWEHYTFLNENWKRILQKIVHGARKIGTHTFNFGDEIDRDIFDCTQFTVTRTNSETNPHETELDLEIQFKYKEHPDEIQIQNQSIILFRGLTAQLDQYIKKETFFDTCRSFFYEGIKKHIYGCHPFDPLLMNPVYEDSNRNNDQFNLCFDDIYHRPGDAEPTHSKKQEWSY